jgi:hypothetical protein
MPVQGIGSSVLPFVTPAVVAFVHAEGGYTFFDLAAMCLMPPVATPVGLPSLLGMDVLCKGKLLIDPEQSAVYFDVPNGRVFEIEAPWA